MLKRPISGTQNAEAPKKRKILPVFLGALGGTLTQQQSENAEVNTSVTNVQPSLGGVQVQQQQLQALPSSSTGALRVNPSLIGRVHNEETTHHDPTRASSSHTRNKSESIEKEMFEDSTNHSSILNTTLDNTDKHSKDDQRQLPMRLESSAKLKDFPQAIDLQNIAKVKLAAPILQKSLEVSVDQGAICQVDQILVRNSLNGRRGIKYANIQAKFGRELKWGKTMSNPIVQIKANYHWVVSIHDDNNLSVFSSRTGQFRFSMHLDSPVAILEIRDDICLAVTTEADLYTWDLKRTIRLVHTSIKILLLEHSSGMLQVVRMCLSSNGVPVLVLSNGDIFVYSRSLVSWLSLNLNRDYLCSHLPALQFIAHSIPDGLISMLNDVLNSGKLENRPPASNVQLGEAVDSANEESQLEILLRVATELNAKEEYRLLSAIYLQTLIKKGKIEKIAEYVEEIRTNEGCPVSTETILDDIKPLLKNAGINIDEISSAKGRKQRELEASLSLLT